VEVIPNEMGNRVTFSGVTFSEEETTVGDPAYNAYSRAPKDTATNVLRLLGKEFGGEDVAEDLASGDYWTTELAAGACRSKCSPGNVEVKLLNGAKKLTVQELVALILAKMKETAETYLGEVVKNAVISVPGHFGKDMRELVRETAEDAGLHVLRLVSNSSCAAMAYGFDMAPVGSSSPGVAKTKNLLVLDVGGTSVDATVLAVDPTKGLITEKRSAGTSTLGAAMFEKKLMEFCVKDWRRKNPGSAGARLKDLPVKAKLRVKQQCGLALKTLSSSNEGHVVVECFHDDKDMQLTLTRARFQEICQEDFEEILSIAREAVCGEEDDDEHFVIDDVVLSGGGANVPRLEELLKEFLAEENGKKTARIHSEQNPDEVVASGAAIQAEMLLATHFRFHEHAHHHHAEGGSLGSPSAAAAGLSPKEEQHRRQHNSHAQLGSKSLGLLSKDVGYVNQSGKFVKMLSKGEPLPASAKASFELAEEGQDLQLTIAEDGEKVADVRLQAPQGSHAHELFIEAELQVFCEEEEVVPSICVVNRKAHQKLRVKL